MIVQTNFTFRIGPTKLPDATQDFAVGIDFIRDLPSNKVQRATLIFFERDLKVMDPAILLSRALVDADVAACATFAALQHVKFVCTVVEYHTHDEVSVLFSEARKTSSLTFERTKRGDKECTRIRLRPFEQFRRHPGLLGLLVLFLALVCPHLVK